MKLKNGMKGILPFLFFLWAFSGFAVEYAPFSENNQEVWSEKPGLSDPDYVPFETGLNSSPDSPALYGPGGDPIGGLPVQDSLWTVLLLMGLYGVYRLIRKKQSSLFNKMMIVFLAGSPLISNAQTCDIFSDDVWYFGSAGAGIIFDNKQPAANPGYSKVRSGENSLSVSGPGCGGNLIFYSQHNQLYNAANEFMKNGTFTGHSSVADGLAACFIGNNQYMLFSVTDCYEGSTPLALQCHIVDMSEDGGLGARISTTTIESANMAESIEIIPKTGTSNDYWLVYRMRNTDQLIVRSISNGVISGILHSVNLGVGANAATYTLRANQQYTKLGLAYPNNKILALIDFDPATGTPGTVNRVGTGLNTTYGVEFSPSGQYVYVASWNIGQLRQYNITAGTWSSTIGYGSNSGGGLKLGPDGRIYVMVAGTQYMGVISNPEVTLTASTYNASGFPLGLTNSGLAISTGLTPPAVCPEGRNEAPVAVDDEAVVCMGESICVNVLENDYDPNTEDLITLDAARFSVSTENRFNLSVDPLTSSVCLSPKTGVSFTHGEKIDIIYRIKDNNRNPLPKCSEGILTVTVTELYEPEFESQAYLACVGATVKIIVKDPKADYTFNWYSTPAGGQPIEENSNACTILKDQSTVQSLWVEPVSSLGISCVRTQVDVILNDNCGLETPVDCAAQGGILFREDAAGKPDPYTRQLNICSGTNLYFSAWMSKDNQAVGYNNNLIFVLEDLSGNRLMTYYPYPELTDSERKHYGFSYRVPSGISTVIFKILDNGGYIPEDIEARFCAPPVTVDGARSYCPGENLQLTINYSDNGTFGNYDYGWIYCAQDDLSSFDNWTFLGYGQTLIHPANEGYYRAIVGPRSKLDNREFNCCAISDPVAINSSPSETVYWSKNAGDSNWNNPDNWEYEDGTPFGGVPQKCHDVHIPGNAAHYPNLDISVTVTNIYGHPRCNNITFHFGSEVAKHHLLDYEKAYIQYNFGYYQGTTNIYRTDGDSHSATPMQRNRWYALAAPLKKIVSGDFSVGGYPNMWQQGFKSTQAYDGSLIGDWYSPVADIALPMENTHHAISVWAARMQPFTGENKHENLNALKGIIELPYFENSTVSDLHRIHSYENGISTFKYYDTGDLSLTDSVGTISRGNEAYRFLTEDLVILGTDTILKVTVPTGVDVMVGNPFLSSLNFNTFYNKNSAVIENYYRLYEHPWSTSAPGLTSGVIPSFQSFFVKTKGTPGSTVELQFPVSASVVRTGNYQLKSSQPEENLLIAKVKGQEGTPSKVYALLQEDNSIRNVPQLFVSEENDPEAAELPQLFILGADNSKNVIYKEISSCDITLNLGVRSSVKKDFTISFDNLENLSAETIRLKDNLTGWISNLKTTDSYTFTHDPENENRFEVQISGLRAPTGIEDNQSDRASVNVYASGKTLYVNATEAISNLTVYTLQGVKVMEIAEPGQTFNKILNVTTGTYIVKIELGNGKTETKKFIME